MLKNHLKFSFYLFVNTLICSELVAQSVQRDIKLYGPGLDPINVTLPAHYLILESNGKLNNKNLLEFKVSGETVDGTKPCRIWPQVLDKGNGTFILRYKLFESCTELKIRVLYDNEHILESPYTFGKAIAHPEKCYCPKKSIVEWIMSANCKASYKQINEDLKQFSAGINWKVFKDQVIKRFDLPNSVSICNYAISDNKIHRKCYGKHVDFKQFSDSIFLSLARKMKLPDVDFFMNLGDWPLVLKKPIVPVFSWCGSDDSYDIVLPTYDLTTSTLENMGRVMLDMLSIQGNVPVKWENRIEQAFWRGRDSSLERLKLIDISKEDPHLFNVSLTNFFFFRDQIEKYGPKSNHISFFKFFDYKYQICMDGTVAAYRLPYLLAGGSLVLKQDSKYYEHFYKELIPSKHYLPIKRDLSDLKEKILWAQKHDAESQQMARNSKEFVNEYLLPLDVLCYHAVLLKEYSKLLKSKVEIQEDMEAVEQPNESNCICHNFSHTRDEF